MKARLRDTVTEVSQVRGDGRPKPGREQLGRRTKMADLSHSDNKGPMRLEIG